VHELKTYSVQISEYIKKGLLEGKLQPGDKINEVHLAAALSISRAPVREALQMLVKDGLIVSVPQRGKFIKTLTSHDIYEHYSLGGVLEGASVASCIRLFTDKDFARLENIYHEMAGLDESYPGYAASFAALDIEFHDTLVAKAPNRLMAEQARTVCQRLSKFLLFRHWPHAFSHSEVVGRHREVLDGVNSRSPAVIEETLRAHYNELGLRMAKFGSDAGESR
jgi:DNA-binding GntR family transcriptional regulator